MKILAVDPGTTTGYVLWEGYSGVIVLGKEVRTGVIRRGEFVGGWKVGVSGVLTACRAWSIDELILEDFILEGGDHSSEREGLDSCRINACVEFCLNRDARVQDEVIGIHYQSPSSAKGVITDERLKLWNLWYRGHDGIPGDHVRDATRHLCLFLRSVK